MDFIVSFSDNIITVIGIACLGAYLSSKYDKYKNIVWGMVFGFGTFLVMQDKIYIEPGRFVDFRYLTMTFAGYFGGIIPAIIAACISGGYRWSQGGGGMLGGVITVFTFGFIGVYLQKYKIQDWGFLRHIFLGIVLTTIALIIIPVVPPWSWASIAVVEKVALPLYLLVPIGSFIGFKILFILQEAINNHLLLREEVRLLELEPDSTIIRSKHGIITLWNQKAEELYGWTKAEAIGKCSHELLNTKFPEPLENINKGLLDVGRWEGELIHTHKDGHKVISKSCWLLKHSTGLDEIVELNLDITEMRRMDEELKRLSVLHTVGEIAAGISHEVRNPMTTVRGYLQYYLGKEKLSDYHEQFQTMIDELDRANSIISEFLSLARNKVADMKLANLNETIIKLKPLIQADAFRMGHDIHIETGLNIPNIQLNKNEIRQLILNLTRNGFEAMKKGGILSIATYLKDNKVVLSIKDTGTGIPDEVLEKIGTPFFTTKDNGTGLGLSVCYRIAERHNAKIDIDTSPKGTVFSVKFPVPGYKLV